MLKHTTVSTARAWNSWSDRPGEMVFLPLGIRVTPLLYSSRLRQCIKLEPRSDTLRLGRHNIDGTLIEFEADLAGTTLAFATTKPHPFAFRTRWSAPKPPNGACASGSTSRSPPKTAPKPASIPPKTSPCCNPATASPPSPPNTPRCKSQATQPLTPSAPTTPKMATSPATAAPRPPPSSPCASTSK